jgi:hypothetical protein
MRDLWPRLRTRVDRLAAAVVSQCDGQHSLTNVSFVQSGEPVPEWPPADAATGCVCGAELEYHHIIHVRDASDVTPRRDDSPR